MALSNFSMPAPADNNGTDAMLTKLPASSVPHPLGERFKKRRL
jgi:hypothetical protein